jgi:hypothetical protein
MTYILKKGLRRSMKFPVDICSFFFGPALCVFADMVFFFLEYKFYGLVWFWNWPIQMSVNLIRLVYHFVCGLFKNIKISTLIFYKSDPDMLTIFFNVTNNNQDHFLPSAIIKFFITYAEIIIYNSLASVKKILNDWELRLILAFVIKWRKNSIINNDVIWKLPDFWNVLLNRSDSVSC